MAPRDLLSFHGDIQSWGVGARPSNLKTMQDADARIGQALENTEPSLFMEENGG